MMKKWQIICVVLALQGCKDNQTADPAVSRQEDTTLAEEAVALLDGEMVELTLSEANTLAQLPLDCINVEYPNKLNQTLASQADLGEPKELHPAFYGCFDWHSAVHGHWALVSLLKEFPELEKAEEIRAELKENLSKENILAEVEYFKQEEEDAFERTYGWAWFLKLVAAIHTWEDPLARELEKNLQPLTSLITERFMEFLPKLNYPIRVGEHTNTAFALSLAYDYAMATDHEPLAALIKKRAVDFYLSDDNCPLSWEPSGFDFLSPCLSEVDIMRKVLPESAFKLWMADFLPQLKKMDFAMKVAEVTDRSDGKLVHLDGLNFSRAWVLLGLASQYPEQYGHLKGIAHEHIAYSFPNLVGDTYEGGHWLGTFALYALQQDTPEQ